MKKHFLQIFALLLLVTSTAITCEDEYPDALIEVPCTLEDVKLVHWDNAGELPKEPIENRIPKEAYILEICLSTAEADDETDSYYDSHYTRHVLSDGIQKIQIFTETALTEEFPAGTDVTSCFYDYPKTVNQYQQTDYTARGGVIWHVDKTNRIYKALMTIPQAGKYRFRVLLTMESGATVERISESVILY